MFPSQWGICAKQAVPQKSPPKKKKKKQDNAVLVWSNRAWRQMQVNQVNKLNWHEASFGKKTRDPSEGGEEGGKTKKSARGKGGDQKRHNIGKWGKHPIFTLFAWFTCIFLHALLDQTSTALSCFFFFFFGGDFWGTASFAQMPHWGGNIYSARCEVNDIARPRTDKIMIYHIQSYSELFIPALRTKFCNVIGFDLGISLVCV